MQVTLKSDGERSTKVGDDHGHAEIADASSRATIEASGGNIRRRHLDGNGPRREAARNAISKPVQTLFDGSVEKAMAALLDSSELKLSDDTLKNMEK
ncbi:MAG: hypothetical protein M2R45_04550 [Verrucomicrobia subdivision 3 bacterium]|nr:hypothetical protein [Limisphaerales bacterium]MCS1416811.1 hypothetical protein [Limisphaerales bacterium]